MYHIKNDKRSIKSAELICEGFLRCLDKKEFQNITITDIQDEAGVGRATFYRLFDEKADILSYQCDQILESILTEISDKKIEQRLWLRVTLDRWLKYTPILNVIIQHGRRDILIDTYMKQADKIAALLFLDESSEQHWQVCSFLSAMLAASITMWINMGDTASIEQLIEQIQNSFIIAGPLFGLSISRL